MLIGFDTETTGTGTLSRKGTGGLPDQPYQLAVIIYDDDLKEIASRNYYFRPATARMVMREEMKDYRSEEDFLRCYPRRDELRALHLLDRDDEIHPENLDMCHPMNWMAGQVNHRTTEDLMGYTPFEEYGEEIVKLFESCDELMAYNADFDVDQLIYEASLYDNDWAKRLEKVFFDGEPALRYGGAQRRAGKRYRDAMYEIQDALDLPKVLKLDQALEVIEMCWDRFTEEEKELLREYAIGEEQTHDAFDDVRQMVGLTKAFEILKEKDRLPSIDTVIAALRRMYSKQKRALDEEMKGIEMLPDSSEKAYAYAAHLEKTNGLRFRLGGKIDELERTVCVEELERLAEEVQRNGDASPEALIGYLEKVRPLEMRLHGESIRVHDANGSREISYIELFGLKGDGDSFVSADGPYEVEMEVNDPDVEALTQLLEKEAAKHPDEPWAEHVMNARSARIQAAEAVLSGSHRDVQKTIALATKYKTSGAGSRKKNVTWTTAKNNYMKLAGSTKASLLGKRRFTDGIVKPEWDLSVPEKDASLARRLLKDEWGLNRSRSEIRGFLYSAGTDMPSWKLDIALSQAGRQKAKDEAEISF